MGTFIRLFIVGVIIVVLFRVAAAMLPYVFLGFLVLYIVRHYKKQEKNEVIVREKE